MLCSPIIQNKISFSSHWMSFLRKLIKTDDSRARNSSTFFFFVVTRRNIPNIFTIYFSASICSLSHPIIWIRKLTNINEKFQLISVIINNNNLSNLNENITLSYIDYLTNTIHIKNCMECFINCFHFYSIHKTKCFFIITL